MRPQILTPSRNIRRWSLTRWVDDVSNHLTRLSFLQNHDLRLLSDRFDVKFQIPICCFTSFCGFFVEFSGLDDFVSNWGLVFLDLSLDDFVLGDYLLKDTTDSFHFWILKHCFDAFSLLFDLESSLYFELVLLLVFLNFQLLNFVFSEIDHFVDFLLDVGKLPQHVHEIFFLHFHEFASSHRFECLSAWSLFHRIINSDDWSLDIFLVQLNRFYRSFNDNINFCLELVLSINHFFRIKVTDFNISYKHHIKQWGPISKKSSAFNCFFMNLEQNRWL